jgi:hypothetical protein
VGWVTRFHIRRSHIDNYETHEVGGRDFTEYWIPAEGLDEFNANIVGPSKSSPCAGKLKPWVGRRDTSQG